MLNVSPDLASVAAMLVSILAQNDLIQIDILNDPAPRPIPGAREHMGVPPN